MLFGRKLRKYRKNHILSDPKDSSCLATLRTKGGRNRVRTLTITFNLLRIIIEAANTPQNFLNFTKFKVIDQGRGCPGYCFGPFMHKLTFYTFKLQDGLNAVEEVLERYGAAVLEIQRDGSSATVKLLIDGREETAIVKEKNAKDHPLARFKPVSELTLELSYMNRDIEKGLKLKLLRGGG